MKRVKLVIFAKIRPPEIGLYYYINFFPEHQQDSMHGSVCLSAYKNQIPSVLVSLGNALTSAFLQSFLVRMSA